MNQAQLRRMAEERILDAAALLAGGRWAFAYYVAGYSVECALKSCVLAQMIHTGWVFQDKIKGDECRTHNFTDLVKIAGLTDNLNAQLAASAAAAGGGGPPGGPFVRHWTTTIQWKETSRYQDSTEVQARELYEAVTHNPDGVLLWIKNFW